MSLGPDISVVGARQHNLKNVSLTLPRGKLVVFTGPSGSGKTSLAFDTIYAEGERRYVESLSAYARQFLEQLSKPDVDRIEGLSPAIAIEQKTLGKSPRSTVGTITEIADYFRLLFARIGTPHCPTCGRTIEAQTVQQIVDRILAIAEGSKVTLLAPICRGRKGELKLELDRLRREGFVRVVVDGVMLDLGDDIHVARTRAHDLDVVVDRIVIKANLKSRVTDSVELALKTGDRVVLVATGDSAPVWMSERFACLDCHSSLPTIEPRLFSFNSPHGACAACGGLGTTSGESDVDDDSDDADDREVPREVCAACNGTRLSPAALAVKIGDANIAGVANLSLEALGDWVTALSTNSASRILEPREMTIATPIFAAIGSRLRFLIDVGLGYLSLDRPAPTLSSGEGQRIRLATQIGSALVGVIYVLDEPSAGLHARDNERLIAAQKRLRDLGNTVIVVEHDRDVILAADYVVDLGPGAGVHGGEIVAQGAPSALINDPKSVTGPWLAQTRKLAIPRSRIKPSDAAIRVVGAQLHNLKNVTASIPIGLFTCVTGVSGSGKSSLIVDTLLPAAKASLGGTLDANRRESLACKSIDGLSHIDKVVSIDQAPIGRSARSNPATYTGIFGYLRELYAALPDARARGYKPGRFSFNVRGGRCEACQGDGVIRVEMHFLPDIFVACDTCAGRRYNRETLEITYRGLSVADALELTVEQAIDHFAAFPHIRERLVALSRVGLGYIAIGQSANTLSGGEAQRVKLARELAKRATGQTLYLFDEPTTGLHFSDVEQLLTAIVDLRDQGNTVVVIEHNIDVVACADWVIDVGPEAGDRGGKVVAAGAPEAVAACETSHTGRYLKPHLGL